MAKRSSKKTVSRKPTRRLAGLGSPPDVHATREATFSGKLEQKVSGMSADLKDPNRCEIAFAKLIDASVYGGMAEAEAEGHGKSGQKYAAKVADAMSAFKRVCRVG